MEIKAYLSNVEEIKSSVKIKFNLPRISDKTKMAHIFPDLSSRSLLSRVNCSMVDARSNSHNKILVSRKTRNPSYRDKETT